MLLQRRWYQYLIIGLINHYLSDPLFYIVVFYLIVNMNHIQRLRNHIESLIGKTKNENEFEVKFCVNDLISMNLILHLISFRN